MDEPASLDPSLPLEDDRHEKFCNEYVLDFIATQAALRAGYARSNARVQGHRLLTYANVKARIEYLAKGLQERSEITQEAVLQKWWEIATADPNELTQLRRTCCRHCHGENFAYQWRDENEFANALAQAKAKKAKIAPKDDGGFGFRRAVDPHPDCPHCDGEGIVDAHMLDTRDLSPSARRLFAGVKITNQGLEIKMRDQDAALTNVAKHLGMFLERHMHTGADGGAIAHMIKLVGVKASEAGTDNDDD